MPPLDLSERRTVGELLTLALSLWFRHFPVFFALAFVVVAPVLVLVDGLWAGTLDELEGGDSPWEALLVSGVLQLTVVPALVTAMHVTAVQDVGGGAAPSFARSARAALRVVVPVALVVALYGVAVGLGLLALVIPGIWLGVRWYFAAQSAVVDGTRGKGALDRSAELVQGEWWRVLGILFVLGFVGFVASGAIAVLLGLVVGLLGEPAAGFVVGNLLVDTLLISWSSLTATLLFFDLRARTGEPVAGHDLDLLDPGARRRPLPGGGSVPRGAGG